MTKGVVPAGRGEGRRLGKEAWSRPLLVWNPRKCSGRSFAFCDSRR
ncbi:unnamed protein product [Ectocarpus sp. 8 AP-2014]